MRFFDSRIESGVVHGRLFVTSEQFHASDGTSAKREFKVRVCGDDGDCETLMDEKFDDLDEAEQAIEDLVSDEYEALGEKAFAEGEERMVPRFILVNLTQPANIEAGEAWYRGWDRANLAAPVEGMEDV